MPALMLQRLLTAPHRWIGAIRIPTLERGNERTNERTIAEFLAGETTAQQFIDFWSGGKVGVRANT